MRSERKLFLLKQSIMSTNPEINEEEWNDMLHTEGFSGFLDGACLAMDMHFNRRAVQLLKFKKDHPEITSDEEVILGFELSENIKRALKK